MEIVQPDNDDFDFIAQIYNEAIQPFLKIYTKEEIEHFQLSETKESIAQAAITRQILCIKEGDAVIGYAVFYLKNKTTLWVNSFYISPAHQGKGIGKALLSAVENYAHEVLAKIIALETHTKATWAIDFYKKCGYIVVNNMIDTTPYNLILDKPPVSNRPILAKTVL